jgi:hypothetical protein
VPHQTLKGKAHFRAEEKAGQEVHPELCLTLASEKKVGVNIIIIIFFFFCFFFFFFFFLIIIILIITTIIIIIIITV